MKERKERMRTEVVIDEVQCLLKVWDIIVEPSEVELVEQELLVHLTKELVALEGQKPIDPILRVLAFCLTAHPPFHRPVDSGNTGRVEGGGGSSLSWGLVLHANRAAARLLPPSSSLLLLWISCPFWRVGGQI